MTATPVLELELTDPLEACTVDVLVAEVVDVDVDDVDVVLDAPGMVMPSTAAKTPRAATAPSATPAVSWLIRRSARARAEILA